MKKAGIALKISNCQNSLTKAEVNELKINTAKQISISFLGLKFAQSRGTIGAQKVITSAKILAHQPASEILTLKF